MPATTDPQSYLPGIVDFTSEADGSVITSVFAPLTDYFAIPLSALPELTLADADPDTGDIRKIAFALLVALKAAYDALPTGERPTKWVPTMSTNALASGQILRIFSSRFTTSVTDEEVSNE